MKRAIIFSNGVLPDLQAARTLLQPDDIILCADGGTRQARALGLKPDTVIGDLDSLSKEENRELMEAGIKISLFPADKDQTDLSLAMAHAAEAGYDPIVIMGGLGRRLDMTLGNVGLLASPAYAAHDVRLDDGLEEVILCRDQVIVRGMVGDMVSLIPWSGIAGGVRTENLQWPLRNENLQPGETRGISNVMTSESASIDIAFGLLLVVHRRAKRDERLSSGSS